MALRYAIQHRSTKRFLAVLPSVGRSGLPPGARLTVAAPADGVTYETAPHAHLEHRALEHFAGAWEVVPVDIPLTEGANA